MLASSEVIEAGLRINEIQSAPLTGRAEWIELAVVGTLPVFNTWYQNFRRTRSR